MTHMCDHPCSTYVDNAKNDVPLISLCGGLFINRDGSIEVDIKACSHSSLFNPAECDSSNLNEDPDAAFAFPGNNKFSDCMSVCLAVS